MKTFTFRVCVFLTFWTSAAWPQRLPPKQDATFALANPASPESVNQMTSVIKTVAHVMEVSFDAEHSTFALRGFAGDLGLAEWLLRAIDKPAGWQPTAQESDNVSAREYLSSPGGSIPPDDRIPVTRIYYLNSTTQLAKQEILTAERLVGGIQFAFVLDNPRILVFRHNAATVALAEWMVQKLDVPADGLAYAAQSQNPQAGIFKLPDTPDGHEDIVRIFYLDPSTSPKALFAMTKSIREKDNTARVFQKTSPPAIAVRGNSALLAQAQQIVNSGSPESQKN
jgi:hypothetical protein